MEPKNKTDKQAVEAGQRLIGIFSDASDEHYSNGHTRTPEAQVDKSRDVFLKRIGVGVLLAFALAGGVAVESYASRPPEFSASTTTYRVEDGDGIGAAASHVEGIDQVDPRDVVEYIKEMPQNSDTLKDGLQPGETLVTPESVSR